MIVIARHETYNQVTSISYWTIIIWPLLFTSIFDRYEGADFNIDSLSSFEVEKLWGNVLPGFIFMVCLSYVSIIASSVATDKTSKLGEILIVMVDAKEQLFGKIMSIYLLLGGQMLIYLLFFKIYGESTGSRFLIELFAKTPSWLLVYVVLDTIVAIFISLIWTTEFASYINDESQIPAAIIPVMLLIGTGAVVAIFFNSPVYFSSGISTMRVYINVILVVPPIGSLLFPTLLAEKSVTYWEALLNLVLELLITTAIFRKSVKQYREGMLSKKIGSPMFRAFSMNSREKYK
ncbi:ABC transporter permease family protein [Levilactobacillus cerevisiae]|uniref:ABC transporter permease n=1 Tax=Levilactobacillus cerevisiae TaxID=1704076 RepID=UPI000F79841A|nr:ABC transporter permease [Levilactobacillus cerevisiae]